MIEFLSTWAKNIGLAIIVISILEMLLPNNKTKKYVRMIFGMYIIFSIISPFINNKNILDVSSFDLEQYANYTSNQTSGEQTSMDNRIEEIYIEELEKDITKKVEDLGYQVVTCNVYATLSSENEESYIEQITLTVEKGEEQSTEENNEQEDTIENRLVEEIQKIKPVNTTVQSSRNSSNGSNNEQQEKRSISNQDIQKIKKFLTEEYGVEETCLKIN